MKLSYFVLNYLNTKIYKNDNAMTNICNINYNFYNKI